ncbi:hypothetical protein [Eudoraea chungangensis]|nr:hypothetical protein [Eudoraea chungangensis]
MKHNIIELNTEENLAVNGGGIIYDLYRIYMAEEPYIWQGFKKGLNKGFF